MKPAAPRLNKVRSESGTFHRGIAVEHVQKTDVDLQLVTERFMQCHLSFHVLSKLLADGTGAALESPTARPVQARRLSLAPDATARALDHCADKRTVHVTSDLVTFPVPGHTARSHTGRTKADIDHVRQATHADRRRTALTDSKSPEKPSTQINNWVAKNRSYL